MRKKREKFQKNKIRSEKVVTSNTLEIQRIIEDYYEEF